MSYNNRYACSIKCASIKSKETNLDRYGVTCTLHSANVRIKTKKTVLEKYGVDNVFQSEIIKDKIKETNLERYGVEHNMELDFVKNKIKKTNLDRYGVTCFLNSEEGKLKTKKTILEKYGVEHQMLSDEIKHKMILTNIDRYGVDNIFKHNEFKLFLKKDSIIRNDDYYIDYLGNSISLFNCDNDMLHIFSISTHNYHSRIKNNIKLCTVCNPIGDQKSIKEKDLLEFIENNYDGEVISGYRDRLEIDIYLPELKIGFEFNGLFHHSNKYRDNNYHLDKTNHFKDRDIRVIHVWEDDWTFKKDIVKSQILNLLNKNTEKIFARKCYTKEVSVKETRKFLDSNHIQGFVSSTIKIGLYHQDELISIMTFDSFEGRKKMEEGGYNLSRFCNKINTNVVGGASKLLNHFIKNYNVIRIVSYADKDWSVGSLYYTLGFENVGGNGPDYKYIVNKKRVHKSRYKKSKLKTTLTAAKQMEKDGILKVYDCGKIKFEYKN